MESDLSYFRRRALEERMAALKACHPNARKSHLDMAARYDQLVNSMAARHEYPGLTGPQDREWRIGVEKSTSSTKIALRSSSPPPPSVGAGSTSRKDDHQKNAAQRAEGTTGPVR